MTIERFEIGFPDAALADLDRRLAATRWAHEFANEDWRYGVEGGWLRDLVDHWRTGFDWRAQEAAMNRFTHFRTAIDGVPIHFMHVPGKGPAPIPLILSHGWPWTFWDWHELISPSMPGYAFSTPLATPGVNGVTTADLWAALMTKLGHHRFAALGGDWGAFVTAQLGHKYAERLIGIHLLNGAPLDAAAKPLPQAEDYGADGLGARGFARRSVRLACRQTARLERLRRRYRQGVQPR
jgi:pimeloyl-ACP methyl ester carboxylesterase